MKITFYKNNRDLNVKKIRIFVKDLEGNDIQIDLNQGEFIYTETNEFTNSIRIYERKGAIKIEDKTKPEFLNYYIGYEDTIPAKGCEIEYKVFEKEQTSSFEGKKDLKQKPKATKNKINSGKSKKKESSKKKLKKK